MAQLKKMLGDLENENADIVYNSKELQLKCFNENEELEKLSCLLQFAECQIDISGLAHGHGDCSYGDFNLKVLELRHQIEMKEATLKSLQVLESSHRRLESVERVNS